MQKLITPFIILFLSIVLGIMVVNIFNYESELRKAKNIIEDQKETLVVEGIRRQGIIESINKEESYFVLKSNKRFTPDDSFLLKIRFDENTRFEKLSFFGEKNIYYKVETSLGSKEDLSVGGIVFVQIASGEIYRANNIITGLIFPFF